ncbi:MAG: hypothetical protein K6E98_05305 [Lachnospiraceae bacterium]|nr:hypothetical protein [Lachnospiraceae bacterium]
MNDIGIHAIIEVLRGLNNSITITRMISELPISKSTLDRGNKENKWPRSLIISDVKNLFSKYRDLYFEGQNELISQEIINLLRLGDYPYEKYEDLYNKNGYDPFINTLLNDAYVYSPKKPVKTANDEIIRETDSSDKDLPVFNSDSLDIFYTSSKNRYFSQNWLYLFFWGSLILALFLILKLNKAHITDVFIYLLSLRPILFTTVSVLLAISTVIAGRFIDTTIALNRYKSRTGNSVNKSEKQRIEYISLYGDDHKLIKGEGRFNCNKHHMIFAAFCNLTSGMWTISLFLYLNTITHIDTVLQSPYLNVSLSIAFTSAVLITFIYNYFEQNLSYPENLHKLSENPDTYLQNRLNVIFNNLHLIINLFFCISAYIILLFEILFFRAYKVDNLDFSFILVVISAYMFLWFSSVSPYAIYFDATSIGNFVICPPILVIFSIIYNLNASDFGHNTILLFIVSILILISWGIILYKHHSKEIYKNSKTYNYSMLASAAIIIGIFIIIISYILFRNIGV